MAVTYSTYLKISELLSLQEPKSEGPEHDELLFIIIHQVYELWFKETLHELEALSDRLRNNDEPGILRVLKRLRAILKTLVGQVDILETMNPISFESFRDRLESSSGFQSTQFRLIEFKLGKRSEAPLKLHEPESLNFQQLTAGLEEPCIYDDFLHYLKANDYPIPDTHLRRDVSQTTESLPEVQTILIDIYRNDPSRTEVCELLVDIDEGLQEWRYRHVKMVQRTLGAKIGTGGSKGAAYLITTLFTPLFPDLWEIRSEF